MSTAEQFEAIVAELYEPLYRFARSLTRTEADAQDLTQHTFYVWATKGHQLRDWSRVKSWLFTTLHRTFLARWRREGQYTLYDCEHVAAELPVLPPVPCDTVDASQVLSALARLEEVYRSALALFYLEECSYKDIASILKVPVGTVKSRIARGIAQLRGILSAGDVQISTRPDAPAPVGGSLRSTRL